MIYPNVLFILLLFSSSLKGFDLLNFQAEEIIGGHPAYPQNYRYQAAIVGRYNNNNSTHLLGSAVILSDHFLLSAARIIIGFNNQIRRQTFFAVVGETSFSAFQLNLAAIDLFYTFYDPSTVNQNGIIVAKLRRSLNIDQNLHLARVQIPGRNENFFNRTGTVTGYGVKQLNNALVPEAGERVRLTTFFTNNLTYTSVKISDPDLCTNSYRYYSRSTSLCGIMKSDYRYSKRGLCVGDIGTPLVIDNKVVGIAISHRSDCNDITYGSIYTKVSQFEHFIQAILYGNPLARDTYVHNNRPHILQVLQ